MRRGTRDEKEGRKIERQSYLDNKRHHALQTLDMDDCCTAACTTHTHCSITVNNKTSF